MVMMRDDNDEDEDELRVSDCLDEVWMTRALRECFLKIWIDQRYRNYDFVYSFSFIMITKTVSEVRNGSIRVFCALKRRQASETPDFPEPSLNPQQSISSAVTPKITFQNNHRTSIKLKNSSDV